jgi:DNA polymerase (family 10)
MDKDRVAEVLIEIGVLLELKGENPFKTRAYANAARTLEQLAEPLEKVISENRLAEIKASARRFNRRSPNWLPPGALAITRN